MKVAAAQRMHTVAWLLAATALAGCRRTPRSGVRQEGRATAARDGGPRAPARDAAAPDASPADAATALSDDDRALAELVLSEARETAPGSFVVPRVAHELFMRAHVARAAALGSLTVTPLAGGKSGLRLGLGPSPVLAALGLRDGDQLIKFGGRLVSGMRPLPEEAFLRILLLLGDGALDLELDRGGTRVRLHYRVR